MDTEKMCERAYLYMYVYRYVCSVRARAFVF